MSSGLRKEIIRLLGLRSDVNQFIAPDGALRTATNMWHARRGLLQKRRGSDRWSQTNTFAINKIFPYDTGFVAHCGDTTLNKVLSDGTTTAYGGIFGTSYDAPDVAAGWRVRGCVAGKNFMFNSANEIFRLSGLGGTPVPAGGLVATTITLVVSGASGFLADGYSTAYRYCIGSLDNYGREIVGPVSGRTLIANAAGGARTVDVTVSLPSTATEAYFIRVYRSENKPNGTQPDDDLKLVYEAQLKAADITAGTVTFTDIVTEALRGSFIYTSPNAGEGILGNNEPPPYAAEITAHKNRVWYANTRRRAEFLLQILAVGGSNGIQADDVLRINGTGVVLTAKAGAAGTNEYNLETGGTASYNIEQTSLNLVAAINARATTNTIVWARYISAPDDVPGQILIFTRSVNSVGAGYSVLAGAGAKRDCFNPSLLPYTHSMDLARAGSATVTATVVSGAQSFKVGEQITVQGGAGSGSTTFGNGPFTVLTIDVVGASTSLTYSDPVDTTHTGSLAARSVSIYSDDVAIFDQETRPNRIYYSKIEEFEAVPILNYIDVGRQDAAIIACVSADDMLWVFKRDGVFRISGDDESSFAVTDVDTTVVCNARETVTKFQGRPVGLTNKGMMRATVSGLEPMSGNIQKDILSQFVGTFATRLESLSFAVAYDSEEMLLLFFGDNRDQVLTTTILACNGGYIYSGKADEWTAWQWDPANGNGNGKTCGAVNPADDFLYFGDRYLTSGSSTYIYKERKARLQNDHRDIRGDGTTAAITSVVSPVLITADAPGAEKLWQEFALLYDGGVSPFSLTVTDANETVSGGSHTVVTTGNVYISRLWPYSDASRGQALVLTITHDTVNEKFDLAGIQVAYVPLGLEVRQ